MIQRSDDGGQDLGAGRQRVRLRRRARHPPVVRRHAASLGVQARLASRAVADRSRHGLRRGRGRRAVPLDRRRADLAGAAGLRGHGSGPRWQPGAGGMCLHTILLDPSNPERMFVAISAAGAFRTDDAGKTWQPINRGLKSEGIPDPNAEVGHCVHRIAMHPSRPDVLFMQKHWDVMRSDDAGDSWHEISGNLPTDFGFPIDVHAHEPETIYVVPIKSDSEHFPPEGKLRVYRSRTGGNEWEALTNGPAAERLLRQRAARRDGRRLARLVRRLLRHHRRPGLRARPTPATPGRRSSATCPAVLSVEVQTLAMIRVVLPAPSADAGAGRRRGGARGRRPGHPALGARRARGPLPDAARDDPRPRHAAAPAVRAVLRLRARTCRTSPPDAPLPERRRARRRSRSWSSARWPAAERGGQLSRSSVRKKSSAFWPAIWRSPSSS